MAGTRTRYRPGEGDRLREEVLTAAEALLVEAGTDEAVTLRAVAARVGVTTPSVYRHFPSREALLSATCLRVWGELDRRVREYIAGVDDPLRALGRCGRAYARFALEHPVQYRVLMMRPSPSPSPGVAACFRHVVEVTAACVRAGVMRGDAESLALSMWSALHGCVTLLITQPDFPWPDDVETVVDNAIRMAGFGAALSSRIPREATPASADLAAGLDSLTTAWT
ncbi:TetR/AcrR family transcriptional regulator [Amycolatopsis suaedae]|uniref:TetR/AcrR family transcriptional regulator n=1 Tax=Amycolatopsis suaedae TaxID=2510978 RepID=A0A4Q7J812_9PSEU|nr:TetR/AcrR family transcriptional regulator [Amycolatopsis suaedae]RZQ63820.1 TetR/AcrR family transcriptional regulator [Amycolatopsis suaedae]